MLSEIGLTEQNKHLDPVNKQKGEMSMKNRLLSGLLTGCLLLNFSAAVLAADLAGQQMDINAARSVTVDAETFTDEAFRNWVLNPSNLNGAGADGNLTAEEREQIKSIDVSRLGIHSLNGIEYFSALEELDCSRNNIYTLDLSQNPQLKILNCSYNQLTELSLENQAELTSFNANYNRLTSLDISGKEKLRALSVEYNYIEQLDITGNISLEWLNIRTNLLTSLNVSSNTKLKVIEAFDNRLTAIDVSKLSDLEYLDVSSNRLTLLDLSQNKSFAASGSGFSAGNNLLDKIILPVQSKLYITPDVYAEQDPVMGYDRVLWYLDEDLTVEVNETMEAQGQTLYAKRIPNDYTVYFSANGGNGAMQPQQAVYGEDFALSQSAFKRTGYIFSGWNTLPKGNGTAYEDMAQVSNLTGKNQGDRITLYAQWEPVKYTVEFNADSMDALGSMQSQSAVYNQDLTLEECGFTADGKEFAGWAQESGGAVRYPQGASVKNLATQQGETATLYAVWKTPVEELQKPYLAELEQSFYKYSAGDYTAEDWDALSKVYQEADISIRAESDADQMRAFCDSAQQAMQNVMTKRERVDEIVVQWKATHADVLQNLNQGALQEENSAAEMEKAENALRDMTVEQIKQYSALSKAEDIELVAGEALEELHSLSSDLLTYLTAAKWVSSLDNLASRPLSEVTTADFDSYQAKMAQYDQLNENEKNQMALKLVERLKERSELVNQKYSAIGELQGVYYAIDQSEYSDSSKAMLLQKLEDGKKMLESSESSEQIRLAFAQSKQEMANVFPDEETPQEPDEDENEDNSNGGSGGIVISRYAITITETTNGTIASSLKQAAKGTTVTLTVTPQEGYRLESLRVVDRKNSEVSVLKKSDGIYTFVMPESAVTVQGSFQSLQQPGQSFADVDAGAWYYDAVQFVTENKLFQGTGENNFEPETNMTRAMLMTVLYREAGEPAVSEETEGFEDVEAGAWYADAVLWAKQNGITNGEDELHFAPHKSITREQLAVMLHRYAQSPSAKLRLSGFADADQAGDFAIESLKWAVSGGLMSGKGDGILDPKGEANRAQVAQMLMNYMKNKN